MDALDIHLWVNHLPIIGTAIGVLVALVGATLSKNDVKIAGIVIYVVAGLAIFPANFTGEDAEHIVEDRVEWVDHDQIHEHEEAAETAMTFTVIGLVLALLVLFNKPDSPGFKRMVFSAFLAVGIIGCIMTVKAGHEGGKIRRPDLVAPAIESPLPS